MMIDDFYHLLRQLLVGPRSSSAAGSNVRPARRRLGAAHAGAATGLARRAIWLAGARSSRPNGMINANKRRPGRGGGRRCANKHAIAPAPAPLDADESRSSYFFTLVSTQQLQVSLTFFRTRLAKVNLEQEASLAGARPRAPRRFLSGQKSDCHPARLPSGPIRLGCPTTMGGGRARDKTAACCGRRAHPGGGP